MKELDKIPVVIDSRYIKIGQTSAYHTMSDVLEYIQSPDYRNTHDKTNAFACWSFKYYRYAKCDCYEQWTGMQVFDLDIPKNYHPTKDQLNILKKKIANRLSKYGWLAFVCLSTGGHGIHIFTASTPNTNYDLTYEYKRKIILEALYDINHGNSKELIDTLIDDHAKNPTQCIYITPCDDSPIINPNFTFEPLNLPSNGISRPTLTTTPRPKKNGSHAKSDDFESFTFEEWKNAPKGIWISDGRGGTVMYF